MDVFRRFHAAWTEGDLRGAIALADPDFVARPLHGAMFTRSEFCGHEGLEQWFHEMTDPWDRFEAIVDDVQERPPAGVAGLLTVTGYRGDEAFHARVGVVCELRNGRIATLTARNVGDVEEEMRRAA